MGIGRQYTKKSKVSGVMDFSQPSTLGFRTRAAKNLALLRLLSHSPSPSPSPSAAPDADSFRYLQLRNRRLEKPQLLIDSGKQLRQRVCDGQSRTPRSKLAPPKSDSEEDAPIHVNSLLTDSIPCSREIEDFFEYAEQQQHTLFTDKYNFDVVMDKPLPGRYEWVKVLH